VTPEISVTFCSRGRPGDLFETLWRLTDLAADPDQIEMIVAVDPDDGESAYQATTAGLPGQARLWVAPQRYGYTGLHHYLNQLATMASGHWLMWFNDDMRMQTTGWDTVVRAQPDGILWPHANHVQHANIAPIWPKAWSDAAGCVSPTTHMDTWLQRVGEELGCHRRIPVDIVHDRFDVTGNTAHDDATYREGRKLLGPEGMAGELPWDLFAGYCAKVRAARG
jgi:hypothetical protein